MRATSARGEWAALPPRLESTGLPHRDFCDTGIGVQGIASNKNGVGVDVQNLDGGVALQVDQGTIFVKGDPVGQTTLKAGDTSVTVTSNAVSVSSIVVFTPLADPQVSLWLSAPESGSFTINASQSVPEDVPIQFFIITAQGPGIPTVGNG